MAVALLLLLSTAAAHSLGDLARRDAGDTFTLIGEICGAAQCAEHGAGAARNPGAVDQGSCACVCPQRAPLFREDRELCVDDLPECSLATFGTGIGVQRIPFVFLPLKGQIIHPSREITFQGVKTPICAVSGAQFLTRKGFVDLRNSLDADVPFSLFRDEGRTFLQWSGEDELRLRMAGRVMVVRLLCRDVSAPSPGPPADLRGVFTPCVAFRVQGTPPRHVTNVTEVQFAPNAHTLEATTNTGLTVSEYVAIGISSLLLGLIYVASVFLYLHIRKRRKNASESSSSASKLKGVRKKDGTSLTEHDIIIINNERIQTITNPIAEDNGMVKKNPLLSMGRQFHDIKGGFVSDSGSNLSDSEDFLDFSTQSDDGQYKRETISAMVHPPSRDLKLRDETSPEPVHRDESGIERLPDEHVSIVETTDDREIARPVGTTRRKLYFNPAYFEPHLMAEPPPAALEFLTKIREVIAIAKHKMAAKRFQPVLNEIPEEETYPSNGNSIDIYQGIGSQRSGSVVSLKRENSRKKSITCVGCPGCKSDDSSNIQNFMKYNVTACSNCIHNKGDKQNSIRKWLENIPTVKQSNYNDFLPNVNQHNGLVNSLLSLPTSDNKCKIQKQNSFTATRNNMRSCDNFYIPRKSGTLSVRSEPAIRSYNLPLPDFEMVKYNHKHYGRTISRVKDIRPIGFDNYALRNGRSQSELSMRRKPNINNILPDMVNEAIALDHCVKSGNHSSSEDEKIYNKTHNIISPSKSRKTSVSPSGDYETDSLERLSHKKGLHTSTEYADLSSSQASPSLSNALPLEEELTMRNAVYKDFNSKTPSPMREVTKDLNNHYETIADNKHENKNDQPIINPDLEKKDYSLVSEVYVNNNYNFGSTPTSPSGSECSMGSRKFSASNNNISEEKPGCLTIELKDPPENYIAIHESDGFEPDTLDRKQSKRKESFDSVQFSRKDFIKSLNSSVSPKSHRIEIRSSGTFKKTTVDSSQFNSLRLAYEQGKSAFERPVISTDTFSRSKSLDDKSAESCDESIEWTTEEGRILTLELRHSKRQRQCTPPTIKQLKSLARPDILPPLPPTEDGIIYEQPTCPPRKVDNIFTSNQSKNVSGRSLSPRIFTKNMTIEQLNNQNSNPQIASVGSSSSPTRASVQSQHSDYENMTYCCETSIEGDLCRNTGKRRSNKKFRGVNTNTFVKSHRDESQSKFRYRRRKGFNIEDSGYLSSDSASSRKVSRRIVVPRLVSCSDSDDSENEARSESGAESVETHSVFFGSLRKLKDRENSNIGDRSTRDVRNSKRKYMTKQCS